ncbi:MAG TPA: nucleotide pyrophosphatase/phosphodiesterase family protein [Chthoniobacter sp.]|jgi:predicted AlkP superfamily pyrophosphatase or phosphodiesterase
MSPKFFSACLALALAASTSFAAPALAKDRTVILITIDGFPAWLWHDPHLPVPTLHRLAAEGAAADSMEVVNPSITWICHTTLVTGVGPIKHGVLFNGLLVRQGPTLQPIIEPWHDKSELVRVPTIYDIAHQAGLTTGQVDWVAILNSGTIDHEFLEVPKPTGATERELVADGTLTEGDIRNFFHGTSPAWRDMMYNRAAIHILKTHKPNLMLMHYLNTDALNHMDGPGSMASYAGYALVDYQIRDLLASLDAAGLKDKTTVIITTDHGFKKVKTGIWPNVALKKAGLIVAQGNAVKSCDAYVVVEGGLAFAYVTDPAKRETVLPKLREICAGLEGVDKVIDGADAHSIDIPTPAENQGTGDLILLAKPGYAFQAKLDGDATNGDPKNYYGTHGYLASDPELDGVFLAWGYGIKPGTKLGKIQNRDVAPTIAQLLGLPLPNVEGRVLTEMLNPAP